MVASPVELVGGREWVRSVGNPDHLSGGGGKGKGRQVGRAGHPPWSRCSWSELAGL